MAEKTKQENKGEFKAFRELLKKGIGLRTQADFAEVCGITRPYLNTLLKKETISRPTVETLKKMAKVMKNVPYRDLMESCGYPVLNIQELSDAIAADLELFFMDSNKNATSPVTHVPILEMCDTFDMLYCPSEVEEMKFSIKEEKDNTNEKYPDADKEAVVVVRWNDQDFDCTTKLHLYYAMTKSGARVMLGAEVERAEDGASATIKERLVMGWGEKHLMAAIFGRDDDELYPTFDQGQGFSYKETPKKFTEFLSAHRATFCTTEERSKLWRRIVVNGEEPDTACKKFSDEHKNEEEDAYEFYVWTTGDIVASIMTAELKELPCMNGNRFSFYEEDERLPEEERDSVIMTTKHISDIKGRKAIMPYLYFYAHELGVPYFGTCYYRYMSEVSKVEWNKTEEFGKTLG